MLGVARGKIIGFTTQMAGKQVALTIIIKPKVDYMKNNFIILGLTIALVSCGNSNGAGADNNTNPSDTTGRNINSAVNDPNSNMADTMRMRDSIRVKDTTIKDQASAPRKH
jgi:hypothetical protein